MRVHFCIKYKSVAHLERSEEFQAWIKR